MILSRTEVLCILGALAHPQHRTLFMRAYSAGLRVSQVVRLKNLTTRSVQRWKRNGRNIGKNTG